MVSPDGTRRILHSKPLNLRATLRPLQVWGRDPALRLTPTEAAWAIRSPEGPVSLHIRATPGLVDAGAWGPGTTWALERLDDLVGLTDDPESFVTDHPLVRRLQREHAGIRLPRIHQVVRMLVPIVLEQLVTGTEAVRAYKHLERRVAEPAPGPMGLRLPPDPARLAGLPLEVYIACTALGKQGRTIKRLCARADRMEEAASMSFVAAARRLQALPGLGPWSAGSAMLRGLGFADAIILGDYHLPHVIANALAGEERATDARMVELLAPFKGHRGRVIRLIGAGFGGSRTRRGPRAPIRTWF